MAGDRIKKFTCEQNIIDIYVKAGGCWNNLKITAKDTIN